MSEQVEYRAAKRIKVQTSKGLEVRMPGDPVPEAATWEKLSTWMANGSIVRSDGRVVTKHNEGVIGDSGRRARSAEQARAAALAREAGTVLPATGPVIGTSEYLQTKAELEGLTKDQVIQLARDFNLKLHKDIKKEIFIEAILKHVTAPTE